MLDMLLNASVIDFARIFQFKCCKVQRLIDRGLSNSSIKRIFSNVRAVLNLTIEEHGLDCSNTFVNTYLPSDERPKRVIISPEDIKRVQNVCLDITD